MEEARFYDHSFHRGFIRVKVGKPRIDCARDRAESRGTISPGTINSCMQLKGTPRTHWEEFDELQMSNHYGKSANNYVLKHFPPAASSSLPQHCLLPELIMN